MLKLFHILATNDLACFKQSVYPVWMQLMSNSLLRPNRGCLRAKKEFPALQLRFNVNYKGATNSLQFSHNSESINTQVFQNVADLLRLFALHDGVVVGA